MTKRSIFGRALVAGIVFFSGGAAEGSRIVTTTSSGEELRGTTVMPSEEIGHGPLSNQDPRRYPVFYIDRSIRNNNTGQKQSEAKQQQQDEGVLSRILRRLQDFGLDDEGNTGPRADDNIGNYGYNNYNKVEVEEHKEKSITDDDGMLDDSEPTDAQFTDTDLLLNRPRNSVVLRIVLGVVNYESMADVDITTMITMAARAMTLVLNADEEVPFAVYDSLDSLYRDGELYGDFGEAPLTPPFFRGEGTPQQRDAATTSPLDVADDDKDVAKLFLDNVVVRLLDNNWFELTSIYTVWSGVDGAPVESRPALTNIEGICGGSIERAMDRGIYWESLLNVELGDPTLVIPEDVYHKDDAGIIDAKDVGDEYDMAGVKLFCPYNRWEEEALECPKTAAAAVPSPIGADDATSSSSSVYLEKPKRRPRWMKDAPILALVLALILS